MERTMMLGCGFVLFFFPFFYLIKSITNEFLFFLKDYEVELAVEALKLLRNMKFVTS